MTPAEGRILKHGPTPTPEHRCKPPPIGWHYVNGLIDSAGRPVSERRPSHEPGTVWECPCEKQWTVVESGSLYEWAGI